MQYMELKISLSLYYLEVIHHYFTLLAENFVLIIPFSITIEALLITRKQDLRAYLAWISSIPCPQLLFSFELLKLILNFPVRDRHQ